MPIIDNITKRLVDELKPSIKRGDKLSITASTFSIYAFDALRKELKKAEALRFIFTKPMFVEEELEALERKFYIPHVYDESELCGGEFELKLKNELNQRAIAKECSAWIKEKVRFKSNLHPSSPLQGMIHIEGKAERGDAFLGIGAFTSADLGLTYKSGFPALISPIQYPASKDYLKWFDQVWENEVDLKEVTAQVQSYFEGAVKDNSPEFLYFITLYNIFKEFLEDIDNGGLSDDQIGFKESVVWEKLYDFQKDAVIGAINKLQKYNGCILADSVGLGKTFSALGVIKYYELRNRQVLVLCPKKLADNWNMFRYNDKNNILAGDRFNYDVLFHTDLLRESGESNGRELANVNWGNYALVVIDESHNFRNNNATKGKENRYQRLLRAVIKEGVQTKVLMLSATPVNNRFYDLRNQLALAYEDDSRTINSKLDTERDIDEVFKRAQKEFNKWSEGKTTQRTAERLVEQLDFDFFEVLDALTIARSRKHIKSYYDVSAIGKFPKRNRPETIRCQLADDKTITYEELADLLGKLNLAIYQPISYILSSKKRHYAKKYDNKVGKSTFKQSDRERSLVVLMQINLLKRLESSIDSFRKTATSILEKIEVALAKITSSEQKEDYEGIETKLDDENFDWEANWGEEEHVIGKRVRVHLADMDTVRWREDLEADQEKLKQLLKRIKDLEGKKDVKLQKLLKLIDQKIKNPSNRGNKKVLVFTAFADTASYLYDTISSYARQRYELHSALVTGSIRKCTLDGIGRHLNTILTCFSPESKGKADLYPELKESIDILIATDCISEGQNLQDCDYLINYDIHWNPVRIIQRFGRIDRIGSKNDTITMVNFWPDVTLDGYINLKSRVEDRMVITDLASTGGYDVLNENQKELEYRKEQLRRLQDEVVDLEDLKEGVSITDLGLNNFRVDLTTLMKKYGELNQVPAGLHAVVNANKDLPPGTIFVLKNVYRKLKSKDGNRLHPYYLVYLKDDGTVLLNHIDAKKVLDAFRQLCKGINLPDEILCKAIEDETADYRNMEHYSELLQKAIAVVLDKEEERKIKSIFSSGGTSDSRRKGLEDFQLISFLIIR